MVVQVQATITQRRGSPTTLVTGDAWKYSRHTQKKTIKPPNSNTSIYFESSESRRSTKVCYFVLHSGLLLSCQFVFNWLVSRPVNLAYIPHMKGFYECFHVWWWVKAFPWKSNQLDHNEQFQFSSYALFRLVTMSNQKVNQLNSHLILDRIIPAINILC